MPNWLTGFNFLVGLLGVLLLLGVALIILLSRRREEVSTLEKRRADASEDLRKVQESKLTDCTERCAKCQDELEGVTAEHRVLAGIILKDLMNYWQQRDQELARIADLEQELRVIKLRKEV